MRSRFNFPVGSGSGFLFRLQVSSGNSNYLYTCYPSCFLKYIIRRYKGKNNKFFLNRATIFFILTVRFAIFKNFPWLCMHVIYILLRVRLRMHFSWQKFSFLHKRKSDITWWTLQNWPEETIERKEIKYLYREQGYMSSLLLLFEGVGGGGCNFHSYLVTNNQ